MKAAYSIISHQYWENFLFILSWVNLISTALNPEHKEDRSMNRWDNLFLTIFLQETICLSFFIIDLFFEYSFCYLNSKCKNIRRKNTMQDLREGTPNPVWLFVKILLKTFWKGGWIKYKLVLFTIFGIDYCQFFILYPKTIVRYGLFFRTRKPQPHKVPLLIYNQNTLRMMKALVSSFAAILDFLIFFGGAIIIYGGLGSRIFADDSRTYYSDPSYDKFVSDYSDFFTICNSLFVLTSNDNYPQVMTPFYSRQRPNQDLSPYFLIYFIPYIILSIFFFIPVPIAVVYEGFKRKRSQISLNDHLMEMEALYCSFLCLTKGESRPLVFKDLEMLMMEFTKGTVPHQNVKKIFHHLDVHNRGKFVRHFGLCSP